MAGERTEKQKVQEITDKLEEGLKELFESERYKTYLTTMSKFHNYSFNNTLLIAMQKPEEVNLICIFESRSRTKVISGIKEAIKHLDDEAMIELSLQVMKKIK